MCGLSPFRFSRFGDGSRLDIRHWLLSLEIKSRGVFQRKGLGLIEWGGQWLA